MCSLPLQSVRTHSLCPSAGEASDAEMDGNSHGLRCGEDAVAAVPEVRERRRR